MSDKDPRGDMLKVLEGTQKLVAEAKEETMALSAVCAILLAELAMLHNSPKDKLTQVTAGLMGVADGVAGQVPTPATTKLIERLASMVESVLVDKRGKSAGP